MRRDICEPAPTLLDGTSPEWQLVDRWPNKAIAKRIERFFEQLDQIPNEPRSALRFSPEAQKIFNAGYTPTSAHQVKNSSTARA